MRGDYHIKIKKFYADINNLLKIIKCKRRVKS